MHYSILFFSFLFVLRVGFAQEFLVEGIILSDREKKPLQQVNILVEKTPQTCDSNSAGYFKFSIPPGTYIIKISLEGYVTKRMPVKIMNEPLDLGVIYLESDIASNQSTNLIALTDAELLEGEASANNSSLLQASRDLFLNRAAFDFGQAFFRVRGYDSQYGKVLLNGIPMNKFYDGRPQWNNWGGLNDVTRNQEFSLGLQPSRYTFGSLLGTSNIDTQPSKMRSGTRISSSLSNRTYAGRLMVTFTSKIKNKINYSISASRRWASQGYINGTLYDAYAVFGALEYQFNKNDKLLFTGILASNRRGRSAAITEEVFELVGSRYNPNWGLQEGKIRNSRERKITEPILMLNYVHESTKFNLNAGIAYQFGKHARSRVGYFNAPNPDPTYYRYLPSFYINSGIGANFISANTAASGFIKNPQFDWANLYASNRNEKASYLLYDDVIRDTQLTVNASGNVLINDTFKIDFGLRYQDLNSKNYAQINDLLGANFHEDIDTFSNTRNDLGEDASKLTGDIFNYQYTINAVQFEAFTQFKIDQTKWSAFASGSFSNTNYQRVGLFQNERYLDESLGKSRKVSFENFSAKGGFDYNFNGRHTIQINSALVQNPTVLQNVFINPRENNQVVSEIKSEKITSADINYFMRLPKLTGRITGYYSRFKNLTDVNFFFVDSGVGSDFVQEVLTNMEKKHMGLELGLEYQISSAVQLTAVTALGNFTYGNNPSVAINFDTAGDADDLINQVGNIDLGQANIKGYKLAQGPQKAYAIGINYRDPKYWWVGATANYLADNYANISTITRTESFYLDPETNLPFPDATFENVQALLKQKPLDDFYLLNLVGGKSWLKNGKYISVFASVNNVFDTRFRSGGYEQSRNGNYSQLQQDNLSETPSFAPKYWYGYGRTYFLNLAYSF